MATNNYNSCSSRADESLSCWITSCQWFTLAHCVVRLHFNCRWSAPRFTYRRTGVHLFGPHQSLISSHTCSNEVDQWKSKLWSIGSGVNTCLNLTKSPSDFNTECFSTTNQKLSVWEKQRGTVHLYSLGLVQHDLYHCCLGLVARALRGRPFYHCSSGKWTTQSVWQ